MAHLRTQEGSVLPCAISSASGLVSSYAAPTKSFYPNTLFPSSSSPLLTPPSLPTIYPTYNLPVGSLSTAAEPMYPATTHVGPYIPSSPPSLSKLPAYQGSTTSCPYPMPAAVNYTPEQQYWYYNENERGRLCASSPVRFVPPPSRSSTTPKRTIRGYYSNPAGRPLLAGYDVQFSTPPRPPSRRSQSAFSFCAPDSKNAKKKTGKKRSEEDDFQFAIRDLFPCLADWIDPQPRASEAGSRWQENDGTTQRSSRMKLKGGGLISSIFGDSCVPMRTPGATTPRGISEQLIPWNGPRDIRHTCSNNACRSTFENVPTIDTVCIYCGELMKSDPFCIDDQKLARVIETEIATEKVNRESFGSKRNGGNGPANFNSMWDLSEEESDEELKVPLPNFASAPARQFTKSVDNKKKGRRNEAPVAREWTVPDELGGDAYPTDECGKVALPAFRRTAPPG